jgi:tetratricopeptide (TPR) repeat protein
MSRQSPSDLIEQGQQHFNRGDYRRAVTCYQEAAVLARAQGKDDAELFALAALGFAFQNLGDFQKMIEVATQLLARARQTQDETYQMEAPFILVIALARLDLRGRWRELKPLLLEGVQLARHLGNHFSEIYHLARLGRYAVRMGEEEQGFTWLQEALNLIRPETENRFYLLGEVYGSLSLLMRKRGIHAEAIRYAEMAVGARRDRGNPQFVVTAQLFLIRAELAQGERGEALRLVEIVLPQAHHMGWKAKEQEAAYLKGEIERELGHAEEAEVAARQALQLAQEMKLKEEEVECLLSLGQALLTQKRYDEACELLKQARRLSQERNYDDHFNTAEALLRTLDVGGAHL